ncbi:unnamed protein product, partial [Meganyctiphanes norvegica]
GMAQTSWMTSLVMTVLVLTLLLMSVDGNINSTKLERQVLKVPAGMRKSIPSVPKPATAIGNKRLDNGNTAKGCPVGFSLYGHYCFYVYKYVYLNQSEAVRFCANNKKSTLPYPIGDLNAWQTAVVEILDDQSDYSKVWLGATLQRDTWQWPDGSTVQDAAW